MSEEVKPKESVINDSVKIATFEYVAALNYAHALISRGKKGKKLSTKNVERAIMAAIDYGITDSKVKFTNETEAELAGIFAKVLDLRLIIQADKVNKQKQKELNDESLITTNDSSVVPSEQ